MNAAAKQFPGLAIDSPLIRVDAPNFRLPTWPPPDDFPIVVDADGTVVSRYGDRAWNFGPWAGKPMSLGFNDGETLAKNVRPISAENAAVLRAIAAWRLYGPRAYRTPLSLVTIVGKLKPVLALCSERGIVATDLYRFPRVVDEIPSVIPTSAGQGCIRLLHDIWMARDTLGFTILDDTGIAKLAGALVDHQVDQTAYVPPRIWTYQVTRLRECLEDFEKHWLQIDACYRFCIDAYANNAGSLEAAFAEIKAAHLPFCARNESRKIRGKRYYGLFWRTAKQFGIDALLEKWVGLDEREGVKALSTYLGLVSRVGLAYILNFTLMRADEGEMLRVGCHRVETDNSGGEIHLVGGVTTKTNPDQDAWWIASPSVKLAIDVMTCVARLRQEIASHNSATKQTPEALENPYLLSRCREPWMPAARVIGGRKATRNYATVIETYPKLFDKNQTRISADDLTAALRVNVSMDEAKFAVGEQWPFSWHQLRRTGAVNMLASGLVSEASLSYQLKHLSRLMTRYYAQNYYRLSAQLEEGARDAFVAEVYLAMARRIEGLGSEDLISPHGEKRKIQILSIIKVDDHTQLVRDGRTGKVRYSETYLGGCANPGPPCPLGGISNISGCMGFGSANPCEWVLLDRRKRSQVIKLRDLLTGRSEAAPPGSMLRLSADAQVESATRALAALDAHPAV